MPVPKFRTSASKRNMRRSHHALSRPPLSHCSNCKEPKRPHCVCLSCGHYRGAQVLENKKMLRQSPLESSDSGLQS